MGRKRNKYLGGSAGTLIAGAWGLYSTFTTAKDLPEDVGGLAKMIADPPVYAPWLLFAVGVLFLTFVCWRRDIDEEEPSPSLLQQLGQGHVSQNINASHSTINIGNGPSLEELPGEVSAREQAVATRRPPKGDTDLRDIVDRILDRDGKKNLRGQELRNYIREIGHEIMDVITREELTIWARMGSRGREVMSPYDLQQAEINLLKSSLSVPGSWSAIEYTDVQFVSAEVDKIWPPAEDNEAAE